MSTEPTGILFKGQREKRLTDLKSGLEAARKILADLKGRQADTKNTILRLQGAIDVLGEELTKAGAHDGKKAESKKPVPKKSPGQPVMYQPAATAPDLSVATGDDKPGWYGGALSADELRESSGPDRNAVILKAIRRNAPPDRKFTPAEIDELFTGVYGRAEIDKSIEILVRDGMITRIKTGIQVL